MSMYANSKNIERYLCMSHKPGQPLNYIHENDPPIGCLIYPFISLILRSDRSITPDQPLEVCMYASERKGRA